MSVNGYDLETATIDGVTFPFNLLPVLRALPGDRGSRTLV